MSGQPAYSLLCARCLYDVRWQREPRCPECGADLNQVTILRWREDRPLWAARWATRKVGNRLVWLCVLLLSLIMKATSMVVDIAMGNGPADAILLGSPAWIVLLCLSLRLWLLSFGEVNYAITTAADAGPSAGTVQFQAGTVSIGAGTVADAADTLGEPAVLARRVGPIPPPAWLWAAQRWWWASLGWCLGALLLAVWPGVAPDVTGQIVWRCEPGQHRDTGDVLTGPAVRVVHPFSGSMRMDHDTMSQWIFELVPAERQPTSPQEAAQWRDLGLLRIDTGMHRRADTALRFGRGSPNVSSSAGRRVRQWLRDDTLSPIYSTQLSWLVHDFIQGTVGGTISPSTEGFDCGLESVSVSYPRQNRWLVAVPVCLGLAMMAWRWGHPRSGKPAIRQPDEDALPFPKA